MTTIKNKQTGETLTGNKIPSEPAYIRLAIKGCTQTFPFLLDEWEILPPPLPTGIGAVVKNDLGIMWVLAFPQDVSGWRCVTDGQAYSETRICAGNHITILSEGVAVP